MGPIGRIRAACRLSRGQKLLAGGRPQEAASLLERALAEAPGDAGLVLHLALARCAAGDPQSGLGLLESDALEPAVRALFRGILLLEAGRAEEARETLEAGRAADPGNLLIPAYVELARIRAGQVREGVAALQALGLPENFEFQKRLALFLEQQLFLHAGAAG